MYQSKYMIRIPNMGYAEGDWRNCFAQLETDL